MDSFLGSLIVLVISFFCFGVGVIFFGKTAQRSACGTVPEIDASCPSKDAGICPVTDDKTGALKMAQNARISYPKK